MDSLPDADADLDKSSTDDQGDDSGEALPEYQYSPLDIQADEQRFLILHPCAGDKMDHSINVRCSIITCNLFDAEPFIAIQNSRGYRILQAPIEVDGKELFVPVAIEMFLRSFRDSRNEIRLWIRHVCLVERDDLERNKYWTRDFVDTMYAMASSVVDMHQYLVEKLDQGEVRRTYPKGYKTRDKLWESWDKNLDTPRIYPCRLGFRPSSDQPLDQYPCVPLDVISDEIRVLAIAPARDSTAPVVTGLAHCMYYSTFYHALSYTWGQIGPTAEIIMNGQLVKVQRNLEQALRSMRQPNIEVYVWVDALCIDQNNLQERNRQLARMMTIFDYASVVVSYIGETDEDSESALNLIPALQMPRARPMARTEDRWDLERVVGPGALPDHCAALYRLLNRSYFRRVWILQEVAVASCNGILCGGRIATTFERLQHASYNLDTMLAWDAALAQRIHPGYYYNQGLDIDPLSYITKMFYFRNLMSRGSGTIGGSLFRETTQMHRWRDNTPGYLEALILARDFEATDPRDKIFALWNLALDKDGLDFRMDYAHSVQRSYMDFVKAWSKQHGSLDIIAVAESVDQSGDFYKSAASWCPDWSVSSTTSCLVRRESIPSAFLYMLGSQDGELYAANGGVKDTREEYFHFEGCTLYATGIIVDRVAHTFDFYTFCDLKKGSPALSVSLLDAVCRFWRDDLLQYYGEHNPSPYEDISQAYHAMVHGDVPLAWLPPAKHPDPNFKPEAGEQYLCVLDRSRHVRQFAASYSRGQAEVVTRAVLRGRYLFVSENGYMGLAPYWAHDPDPNRKTWLLAILANCSVPVMLLENDDGSYTFGGACFVQGWMEGEYLTENFGANDAAEFWAALKGDQKLRLV